MFLNKVCKTDQKVIHDHYEALIKVLKEQVIPTVVGLVPVLVNDYERAQEVRDKDLEVPELLQKDQGSHQYQNSQLRE